MCFPFFRCSVIFGVGKIELNAKNHLCVVVAADRFARVETSFAAITDDSISNQHMFVLMKLCIRKRVKPIINITNESERD